MEHVLVPAPAVLIRQGDPLQRLHKLNADPFEKIAGFQLRSLPRGQHEHDRGCGFGVHHMKQVIGAGPGLLQLIGERLDDLLGPSAFGLLRGCARAHGTDSKCSPSHRVGRCRAFTDDRAGISFNERNTGTQVTSGH